MSVKRVTGLTADNILSHSTENILKRDTPLTRPTRLTDHK